VASTAAILFGEKRRLLLLLRLPAAQRLRSDRRWRQLPRRFGRLAGRQRQTKPTFEDLKTAVVHGSVTASYTCEAFSTHKLQDVTAADVAARIAELRHFTSFAS
jgi:hypothetical protein